MNEFDAETIARNRRMFALVGGALAVLFVFVGLVLLMSMDHAAASHASAVTVVVAPA